MAVASCWRMDAVEVDHRDGEVGEFGVAVAKIFLAVVVAGGGGTYTFRANIAFGKLATLAGPATSKTLNAITNTAEEFVERSFECDGRIERCAFFR